MVEQLSFWGKEEKEIKVLQVKEKENKLEISLKIRKDNDDEIEISFIFDLKKPTSYPTVKKNVLKSNYRAFLNENSLEETLWVEPYKFRKALKIAKAILNSRLKEKNKSPQSTDKKEGKKEKEQLEFNFED